MRCWSVRCVKHTGSSAAGSAAATGGKVGRKQHRMIEAPLMLGKLTDDGDSAGADALN